MTSLFTGSSTANNFLSTTSIPCMTASFTEAQNQGKCLPNVDGVCVFGGERVAGTSSYQLASLGYPGGQCVSAGLFAAPQQPYEIFGWAVTNNANPLRLSQRGV